MADTTAPSSNWPALAGKKIMLIEADGNNRKVCAYWLEQAGVEVVQAKSLNEAREHLKEEAPDLIWLGDVPEEKPGMATFCQEHMSGQNIPLVVVTCLGTKFSFTETFFKENGADAVFHKSQLSMEDLLQQINRLVAPSNKIATAQHETRTALKPASRGLKPLC